MPDLSVEEQIEAIQLMAGSLAKARADNVAAAVIEERKRVLKAVTSELARIIADANAQRRAAMPAMTAGPEAGCNCEWTDANNVVQHGLMTPAQCAALGGVCVAGPVVPPIGPPPPPPPPPPTPP
jgi:hypothetical protein